MVDVNKVCVEADVGYTWAAQCVPPYEVPCIREWAKYRTHGRLAAGSIKVSRTIPDGEDPIAKGVTLEGEQARLEKQYQALFRRAFPTDEDFLDEFRASLPGGVVSLTDDKTAVAIRKTLPIEVIKGIGPALADGIAAILGDGELETLAISDPIELQGIDGVSLSSAKRFIDDAANLSNIAILKE